MTFFHIVLNKRGLDLLRIFLNENRNSKHIVMVGNNSLHRKIESLLNEEKIALEIITEDFDKGAKKICHADKVVVW